MASFKIKVRTAQLGVEEVRDDDNGTVLRPENPPADTRRIAVMDIVRDNAFGGCWYVHDNNARLWWGWSSNPCDSLPTLRLKINERGTLRKVAYKTGAGWDSLSRGVAAPTQPSVKLTVSVEDDPGPALAPCHYVIIGGKAYKIC